MGKTLLIIIVVCFGVMLGDALLAGESLAQLKRSLLVISICSLIIICALVGLILMSEIG